MSLQSKNKQLVLLDGEFADAESARAAAVSGAVLYGRGVFTTIAVKGGEPFEWPRHVERLSRDSNVVGLETDPDQIAGLEDKVAELCGRNGIFGGKARITIFDPVAPALWGSGELRPASILIQASESSPLKGPLTLAVSPFVLNSASPLAGVKSCNYLEPLLAKEEAARRGFEEAIRLNEKGFVTGCCLANVFWVSRETGILRTPSTSTGCLAGTTRGYVAERTEIEEVEFRLKEFREDAKSVFVTSAVLGISPVEAIEGFGGLDPVPEDLIPMIQA